MVKKKVWASEISKAMSVGQAMREVRDRIGWRRAIASTLQVEEDKEKVKGMSFGLVASFIGKFQENVHFL